MASRDAEQNVTLATDATSYLEEKGIDALLKSLLSEVMKNRPADPLQFMIDSLSMDPLHARQDVNGLSQYRANKLRKVFSSLDKDGSGAIDFKEISSHANRYGGTALREDDLREVFRDFDTDGNNKITSDEFLAFFAKAVKSASNAEFDIMISEMLPATE
eukprot:PRCOL_00001719-RA